MSRLLIAVMALFIAWTIVPAPASAHEHRSMGELRWDCHQGDRYACHRLHLIRACRAGSNRACQRL